MGGWFWAFLSMKDSVSPEKMRRVCATARRRAPTRPLRAIRRHRPPDARRRDRATARLTPPPGFPHSSPFHIFQLMGKQYNKVLKKKRRIAYLKRKKAAASAAKKPAKARK
jgi:hypothetical protein